MINKRVVADLVAAYKKGFNEWWGSESHKLQALKEFTENWDLSSDDFVGMYDKATASADRLLPADKSFPGGMISCMARMNRERTVEAFTVLYDESQPLAERIDNFKNCLDRLLSHFAVDNPNWVLHYKESQSFTAWLFLRYPSKYYLYQQEHASDFAAWLGSSLRMTSSSRGADLAAVYAFFDELNAILREDAELVELNRQLLAKWGLPDDNLHTITWDLSCWFARSGYRASMTCCTC